MTITIDNVRIDTDVERGAEGGPEFKTDVIVLASGEDSANQKWANPRRRWDISYGIQDMADLRSIIAFFKARRGRARGFLFRDWTDYELANENIGTGDSTDGSDGTAAFQITKLYDDAVNPYTRTITRPTSGELIVQVAGVTQTETTHYTVDYSTGVITFTSGNHPLTGEAVTVTGEFDVPVRFDVDFLEIRAQWAGAGSLPSIEIIELRE
jgi:uncharacterized protein (TIGR02217 family)